MKNSIVIALVLTSFSAAADVATIPAVGLVHVDAGTPETYFNYLAAVPAFHYAEGGRWVEHPLLTDGWEDAEMEGTAKVLWSIGSPSPATVDAARARFGVSPENTKVAAGDAFTVAATLSANWTAADDVVVAVYAPDDARARTGAAYAAAVASTLNAPLLYTYAAWTPRETKTALARLGVKRVWLVDFGKACGAARENFAAYGVNVAAELNGPREVAPLLEARARHDAAVPGASAI